MASGNLSILTLTAVAAGVLAANRFVTQDGAYPAAGAKAFGVNRSAAAAAGELLAVDIQGTAIAEAAGTFAKDAALELDASGRVVVKTTGVGVARAMEAGTAGAFVEVLLTPTA